MTSPFIRHQPHGPAGPTLTIEADDNPRNPRNRITKLTEILCWHPRYQLGDPHGWTGPDDVFRALRGRNNPKLPLYLSGRHGLSLATEPGHGRQVGWIVIDRRTAHGSARYALDRERRGYAVDIMKADILAYNQFRAGDVWTTKVVGPADEVLDFYDGLFGLDRAIVEGQRMLDACVDEWRRRQQAKAWLAEIDARRPSSAPLREVAA